MSSDGVANNQDNRLTALVDLLHSHVGGPLFAKHQGRYYSFEQFQASVAAWREVLLASPDSAYALYCHDAYPFAVMLFALLHAGKQVWIPGNHRPGTAQLLGQQGCQLLGDWNSDFDYRLEENQAVRQSWTSLDPCLAELVLFTSGSSGQPKAISKRLPQLQAEVDALESLWGDRLTDSEVLATVSHQHIYGLLFRVLWPISAGRCFHSELSLTPEALLRQATKACWIASPAHLKRLDADTPWSELARLSAVFSSGGALPQTAAEQIQRLSGLAVYEVYGSTETGGIAWRQFPEAAWQLFSGLKLRVEEETVCLTSPYLAESNGVVLDDALSVQADGRFLLQGRLDRIVKVEEKRLSLAELEQRLLDSGLLADATSLLLTQGRDTLAVIAVIAETDLAWSRKALIQQLRASLLPWFDAVVLPRRWLFVNRLPLNAQSKIDQTLLKQWLNFDDKLPRLQAIHLQNTAIELWLKVPENLVYFADHFADYPILPGVVQIGWAEYFGKSWFAITKPFSALEAIKFVKPIQPGCELSLQLHWDAKRSRLQFQFLSGQQSYSSGRLLYAGETL